MPNKNYLAGRRFEYEYMKLKRSMNYKVIRASGSHGEFDLISYRGMQKPEFIQCKVVKKESDADKLIDIFMKDRIPHPHYHQSIRIKVKGEGSIVGDTI